MENSSELYRSGYNAIMCLVMFASHVSIASADNVG